MNSNATKSKLVDAKGLLEHLWHKDARPSLSWVRQHTGRDIPAMKVGRLYFYDPDKVRESLGLVGLGNN